MEEGFEARKITYKDLMRVPAMAMKIGKRKPYEKIIPLKKLSARKESNGDNKN